MNAKLEKLLDKCREENSIQQLSFKMRLPLCLTDSDGNPAAYGNGQEEQETATAENASQEVSTGAPRVAVQFMGETIGFLSSSAKGEHIEILLAAAAHNLETSFKFETEIEDMSSEIVHLYDELATIFSLSSKLGSEMDMDDICQRAVEECKNALHAETVFMLLLEPKSGLLVKKVCTGKCAHDRNQIFVNASTGIIGELFSRKTSSVISDPPPECGLPLIFPCASVLCIPLVTDNRNIGMIIATGKPAGEEFRSQEIKLMDAISFEIAAAIKKAQLYEQINKLFLHTVEALASAIDAKDPYTYGHSRRVADYTAIICRELKMVKKETKAIILASILHDIGKIGTPEKILQKPYRLVPEEIDKIKEHPVLGAQILCAIDELKDVIDGIRHHHEHFDGNGYPDRIAFEQIPIQARIIAVADCFDAMTSNRPYRKSIEPETAITIMEDCSGSQFDPRIFDAFKNIASTEEFKTIYESVPDLNSIRNLK